MSGKGCGTDLDFIYGALEEINMLVKRMEEVPANEVEMQGAEKVKMRLLLSEEDGAPNFRMRLFEVDEGGCSPYHSHDYEHEVLVLGGKGELRGQGETAHPLKPGDVVFVSANEEHQFRNIGSDKFKFICLIPSI